MSIYTIGHSNHSWDAFKELLTANGIELLVDVRSRPVSRFAPFSNRRVFPALLEAVGIEYHFMGDSIGGRPHDQSLYDAEGKPDYCKMRDSDAFREGLEHLVKVTENVVTVMMCSEGEPTRCHRRLLIGVELEERGVGVLHILRDGRVVGEDAIGSVAGTQGRLAL